MKDFTTIGVHANSFEEYARLKEIAESIGWIYNTEFTIFNETQSSRCNSLCFSTNFDKYPGKPAFAFSNCYNNLDMITNSVEVIRMLHLPFSKEVKKEYTTNLGITEGVYRFIKGQMYIDGNDDGFISKIVMCTNSDYSLRGVQLWNNNPAESIGDEYFAIGWNSSAFKPFCGELTLKQSKT